MSEQPFEGDQWVNVPPFTKVPAGAPAMDADAWNKRDRELEDLSQEVKAGRLSEPSLSGTYATTEQLSEVVTGEPIALTDAAVAPLFTDPSSATVTAAKNAGLGGGIESEQITRLVISTNPDEPLNDGELLLVYSGPMEEFTDFSEAGGWTDRWDAGTWTRTADGAATGGYRLDAAGGTGRRLYSFDVADADPQADVEVVARVRQATPEASLIGGGLVVRAGGGAGTEHGYAAYCTDTQARLVKYVNGTYSTITFAPFIPPVNEWYWMRLRVRGTLLRLRVWEDGQPEPADWSVERIDTDITTPGWAGVSASSNLSLQSWDVFGVAADGGTAPKEA